MTTFEEIEKSFFAIEDYDDLSIVRYFYDNQDYFTTIRINDKEIGQKNLWMLSEIINSAYKQKDYRLIKMIVNSTIQKYKDYAVMYNYDLKADTFYKSLIYNVAIDNFENKNYFLSLKYFKDCVFLDHDNFRLTDFYNESKYRLVKKVNSIIGLIGLSLIIVKYCLKLIFEINGVEISIIGSLGAILLITYGIITLTIKKPSH
jgi:hypothetical protein